MEIIQNGTTNYQIVTPGRRFPVENQAARFLQSALLAMTGVRVPVRWADRKTPAIPTIWVGKTEAGRPGIQDRDGYRIEVDGEDLHLFGPYRRGTHYAVFAFLESLGVGFYLPGNPTYPESERVELPAGDMSSQSAFTYRHVFYPDAQLPERALELKLNVHWGDDQRWGPNAYPHSWGHSFEALVPVERYFDDHPEYYSLVDGYRRRERPQLCCTNPDVTEVVCENMARWIEENPNRDIFAVGQNDWHNYCECRRCREVDEREGSHMGQVLTLVNEVAKRFPDKFIATLAYMWSVDAPRHMEAAPNALIVLCHNYGCYNHGLDQCELNEPFLKRLSDWTKRAENILIWDYYVNYRHYLLPTGNFRRIENDFRLYRDMGIRAMFCQGSACTGGQFEHLRQYVQSKLLWNPDLSVETLMTDWAEGVFGQAAAAPVLEYLFALEDAEYDRNIHMKRYSQRLTPELFNDEFLNRGVELWDQAEAVAETPLQKRRVIAHRSAETAARLIHAPGEYRLVDDELRLHPQPDRELVERFVAACIDNNVSYLREDRGAPEDFRRDYGRTYRAIALENESVKALILPEIGGRVYSLVWKQAPDIPHEASHSPENASDESQKPGENPSGGGLELLAVPQIFENVNSAPYWDGYDFQLRPTPLGAGAARLGPGAVEEYRIVSQTETETTIEAETEDGVLVVSTYALIENGLQTRHDLRNKTDGSVRVAPVVNPAWNRSLFDDDAPITCRNADGTWTTRPLNPENRPRRDLKLTGEDKPRGRWRLDSKSSRTRIEAHFDEKEVHHTRIILTDRAVQLQHCFAERTVPPGDSYQIHSEWTLASSEHAT